MHHLVEQRRKKPSKIIKIVSVACQDGSYRADEMTSCQECPAGKAPNQDKTECGKEISNEKPTPYPSSKSCMN